MKMLKILLLVMLSSCSCRAQHPGAKELRFLLVISYGQFGFNSSGAMPAADLALQHINNHSGILQGYSLGYGEVKDSQCHRGKSLDAFFEGIQSTPVRLAVVGCGCSVATEPVAEISYRWNISQISFSSGLAALSDRSRFKSYFRNSPTLQIVFPSLLSTLQHFKWKRIAFITQDETLFTGAFSKLEVLLQDNNITVINRLFQTGANPTDVEDLFVESDDYRVFFLNSYSDPTKDIICKAYQKQLTYPRFAWILYDWYPRDWWQGGSAAGNCTDAELAAFLERAISLRRYPAPDDSNVPTDAGGITPNEFDEAYKELTKSGHFDYIDTGPRLYDVMWVLAVALNKTNSMVESDIPGSGCENMTGSLVPLEDFSYDNALMGCLIKWNLQNTHFSGVSGNIEFDEDGTRIHHVVRLKQYRLADKQKLALDRVRAAYLDRLENYTFTFEQNFSESDIYPLGVPPDGTPEMREHTYLTGLVVFFYVLAALGLVLVALCTAFNFIYRNKKIVKLTSPKLNYFILAGTGLMYVSIFLYLLPSTVKVVIAAKCILQDFIFTVGYTLAFGTVLTKMWRVYQIFQNPSTSRKALKDRHLLLMIFCVVGVAVFLLALGAAVPQLRGEVTLEDDMEHPSGHTELGVRIDYSVWVCYEESSPAFYWKIVIFAYLIVLQIVAILLAFQTRRVKIPGLNDSKHVAAIIYISSTILVAIVLVSLALRAYINVLAGIVATGIIVLSTTAQLVIFIPKMIGLYKDPDGEKVLEKSNQHTLEASVVMSTFKGADPFENEKSLSALRNELSVKEKKISELEQELTALKNQ